MNRLKHMGRVLFFLGLCFLVSGLVSGCSRAGETLTHETISAEEAAGLIGQDNLLILDVRTPKEFVSGHIKDAVLIPVQVLHTEVSKILDRKNDPVLVYCRSGNRSVTASKILSENGFTQIYNMAGGIKAWVKNGFPLQKQP